MVIHLKKLSVGSESVQSLALWQETQRRVFEGHEVIVRTTRNKPKREKDLLDGGSIYWIFQGRFRCRQAILGIEQGDDGEGQSVCKLLLDPQMILTQAIPHRPFQGWRYLCPEDAPKDRGPLTLGEEGDEEVVPEEFARELRRLGLID
jgi:hypothetical protein